MVTINPFDFFVEESAKDYPFSYNEILQKELIPYLEIEDNSDLIKEFVATVDTRKMPIIDFLVALNQKIYTHLNYTSRAISSSVSVHIYI
jgi:hypothetical protein